MNLHLSDRLSPRSAAGEPQTISSAAVVRHRPGGQASGITVATGSAGLLSWARSHWWTISVAALSVFTVISRLPWHTAIPYNMDAVQYILGMHRFDIALHQPHPPGNPLYIVLGRAMNLVIAGPNAALVTLSVLASVGAVIGTALIAERLTDRPTAAVAALLVALNPLFWLYGELALSYAPECAFGLLVAFAAWRAYQRPSHVSAVLLALTFAAAGGLRPTVLPLLGPLWLFGLARMRWRTRLLAVMATTIGCLAWLVPLLWVSGGLGAYLTQVHLLSSLVDQRTTFLKAPLDMWLTNAMVVVAGVAIALNVLILVAAAAVCLRRPKLSETKASTVFLWFWVLPGLATFALIHFGQLGYLLLILPPGILLCLLGIRSAWPRWLGGATGRVMLPLFIGVTLAFSATTVPMGVQHDASWKAAEQRIAALPPGQTIILSDVDQAGFFRLEGYLLPQYHALGAADDTSGRYGVMFEAHEGQSTYSLNPAIQACQSVRLDGVSHIVVTGDSLISRVTDPADWRRTSLPGGSSILISATKTPPTSVDLGDGQLRVSSSAGVPPGLLSCSTGAHVPLRFSAAATP